MINFVTSRPQCYDWDDLATEDIRQGTIQEFLNWTSTVKSSQLDTETTMTESGPNQHQLRKLLVIQLGTKDKSVQWVIEVTCLDEAWKDTIKSFLERDDIAFLGHNIKFDYLVLKANWDITVENLHDTFLMSKILNTGLTLPNGFHSLKGCLSRFYDIDISKEAQTTFTSDPMTKEQILYAATDVVMLHDLANLLAGELQKRELWYLYNEVERHVMKVYADMELTPMRFDEQYWSTLVEEFIEERQDILKELEQEVLKDPSLVQSLKTSSMAIKDNLIQPTDELKVKWNSTTHKKLIFNLWFPYIPEDVKTKPQLKKWVKENEDDLPLTDLALMNQYMSRQYDKLNEHLLNNHKQWLIDNGLFIKANTVQIKWSSPVHKVYVFQHYYPNLSDSNATTLAKITKNPLINVFKKFTKAEKKVSSYGKKFVENYVRDDGMIAPFGSNQILNTGRMSFGILLQMPGLAKFRNAFYPPGEGDVFVDSDYKSAELLIMAYAAGETAFLDAVKSGKDLHMMSASLIFADKWKDVAEEGCTHIVDGSLCTCAEHNALRKISKTITFGLAYGLSPVGLADRLNITKTEAKALMDKFFDTFINLKAFFETNELSGQEQLQIKGMAPTGRVRYFHPTENKADVSSIGRKSKNFPIQEANASMLKVALVKMRREIIDKNLPIKLHLPVHDEILSSCPKEYQDVCVELQERAMGEAADLFLEKGLLGVDTDILDKWTK